MSKNRGFSDTTANRYSLALYELAEEANELIKVEENSNSFLKLIVTNKDFISLIKNPTITQEVLNNIINKIQENFQFDALFKNFLNSSPDSPNVNDFKILLRFFSMPDSPPTFFLPPKIQNIFL